MLNRYTTCLNDIATPHGYAFRSDVGSTGAPRKCPALREGKKEIIVYRSECLACSKIHTSQWLHERSEEKSLSLALASRPGALLITATTRLPPSSELRYLGLSHVRMYSPTPRDQNLSFVHVRSTGDSGKAPESAITRYVRNERSRTRRSFGVRR